MKTIRVFHVIDSLRRDGAQRALVYLVEGLRHRGYQQRVYCLNDVADPEYVAKLKSYGIEVIIVGKVKLLTGVGLARLLWDFAMLKPDVVQTLLNFSDIVGRTAARVTGVPTVVSSVRTRCVDKAWWNFCLDRLTVGWADKVVFNARNVVPFSVAHEGVRPDQVVYIPNGISGEWARQGSGENRIREELGIPKSSTVLGTVGRLYPQKGHTVLLCAFEEVLKTIPDSKLLVIGTGPLGESLRSQALEKGIGDHVIFLGQRRDVPNLLGCLDLYVQPSLWEGMPNAVMEAMAAGLPVIATAVDGTRELIDHGKTGWLVEAGNAQALADQILSLMSDRASASRVGSAAAHLMETEFAIEKMVSRFDRLYRELVSTHGGPV